MIVGIYKLSILHNNMTRRDQQVSEVAGFLHELGMRARSQANRRLAELELTFPMAMTLRLLDQPRPMRDLAEHLACDASYVTGIADRLEERGLVERLPDPHDRRIRRLSITAEGERCREQMSFALSDAASMLSALTEAELDQLVSLLGKAAANENPPGRRGGDGSIGEDR